MLDVYQVCVYYASSRTADFTFYVDEPMSYVIVQVADASSSLRDVLLSAPNGKVIPYLFSCIVRYLVHVVL